jgi:ribosomal protein L40E
MATIAWLLIMYCCGVVSYLVVEFGWSPAIIATYAVLTALSLWAHVKTMMSNPGAVPRSARPLAAAREAGIPETICGRCDAYKPPRSHHCRICARCIVRMDHHCPWMNNCVGALNQKHFVLFLIYTWMQCIYGLTVVVLRLSMCRGTADDCFEGTVGHLTISLVAVSLFALVFVTSMLYNQVYAVLTGIGTIDRMKRRARHLHHQPVPWKDVFGISNCLLWPLPVAPTFDDADRVLGYTKLGNSWQIDGSGDGNGSDSDGTLPSSRSGAGNSSSGADVSTLEASALV